MSMFWKGVVEGFGVIGGLDALVAVWWFLSHRNSLARKEDRLKKIEADIKKALADDRYEAAIRRHLLGYEIKIKYINKSIAVLLAAGLNR